MTEEKIDPGEVASFLLCLIGVVAIVAWFIWISATVDSQSDQIRGLLNQQKIDRAVMERTTAAPAKARTTPERVEPKE